MSNHSARRPRVPAGVTEGGQFAPRDRAESPVHLHVGVPADQEGQVVELVSMVPGVRQVYTDGDSWEEWGERGTTNRHVVVEADGLDPAWQAASLLEGAASTADLGSDRLDLLTSDDEHAVRWVLTDPQDWSTVIAADTTVGQHIDRDLDEHGAVAVPKDERPARRRRRG